MNREEITVFIGKKFMLPTREAGDIAEWVEKEIKKAELMAKIEVCNKMHIKICSDCCRAEYLKNIVGCNVESDPDFISCDHYIAKTIMMKAQYELDKMEGESNGQN